MTKNRDRTVAFCDNAILRPMCEADIERLVADYTFPWSSEEPTREIWEKSYSEHSQKQRCVAIIEIDGVIAGYGSLLRRSSYSRFSEKRIPEIHALWVDAQHRKRGLGTQLIKHLEGVAGGIGAEIVGIGVGLYRDYGPAQKLYFDLGYRPDGFGVTYNYLPTVPGKSYPLDDDFILWLIKKL